MTAHPIQQASVHCQPGKGFGCPAGCCSRIATPDLGLKRQCSPWNTTALTLSENMIIRYIQ